VGIALVAASDGRPRDLSVLDSSVLVDLSPDGQTVLSTELGEGGGRRHSVYLRSGPSATPVRLGDGMALALSPDGQTALAVLPERPSRLIVYPVGPEPAWEIADAGIERYAGVTFFPDGRRVVIAANAPGGPAGLFVRGFPKGQPRPISSAGVSVGHFQGFPVSPDGKWVAATAADGRVKLFPVEGGEPRPLEGLPPSLYPIRWLEDGVSLLVVRLDEVPAHVQRFDVSRGQVFPFREISISDDPAGVHGFPSIRFSRDGGSYAYSYARVLSELYRLSLPRVTGSSIAAAAR
jgi:hypothetical protein